MVRRRGERHGDPAKTSEGEDEPTDDADGWIDFFEAEGDEGPEPRPSFLGALGQMVAAVLVVVLVVALFIAGAILFRWIFR
jgi:hypothetical protein